MSETLLEIAVSDIQPNSKNPRDASDNDPKIASLAESIVAVGLINPVTLRTNPGKGAKPYQLIAGERRWRAHRKAGLPTILARVVEVDEFQARKIINIENLQREDLHWSEEAKGVAEMLKDGYSPAEIAESISRSVQWVLTRRSLCELSEALVDAVCSESHPFHDLPLVRLEALSRFPHAVQDQLVANQPMWVTTSSLTQFTKSVEETLMRKLSMVPWDLDDTELVPESGSCSNCAHRTGCQAELFATETSEDDRCTKGSCFAAKMLAFSTTKVEAARTKNPGAVLYFPDKVQGLVREVTKDLTDELRKALDANYQYHTVKASTDSIVGIIAFGPQAGRRVHLGSYYSSVRAKAKAAAPAAATAGDPVEAEAERKLTKAKEGYQKKLDRFIVEGFIEHLETVPADKLPGHALWRLVAVWGTRGSLHRPRMPGSEVNVAKRMEEAFELQAAQERVWETTRSVIVDALDYTARYTYPPVDLVDLVAQEAGLEAIVAELRTKAAEAVKKPKRIVESEAKAEAA